MLKITRSLNIESFFTAFETKQRANFVFKGERHNFWELVYVVDGCVGVAEDDKIYELKTGDIIFHKPMEFHRIWSAAQTSPHLIIMSFSVSGNSIESLAGGVFKLGEKSKVLLLEALEELQNGSNFEDEITNQLGAICLEKCFLYLIREHQDRIRSKKTKGAQNYKTIIRVMNENIDKNLTLSEIAGLCGLSESNLKKTFRKYSGTGVIKYFNNLKITKAMTMIAEGFSMAQISEQLGFSSPNYFSESFKRYCRMTPMEYKQKYSNQM